MAQVHLPLLAKAHEMAASSCLRVDPMDLVSYPIGSNVKAPYDDSIQIPDRLMWNHDEQKLPDNQPVVQYSASATIDLGTRSQAATDPTADIVCPSY